LPVLLFKMKKKFSKKWKSSKQVRKQRKYLANAPLHIKRKFLSSNLSKELRKKYGRRSFELAKGDLVKVMKGSFRGKTGKVNRVDLKKGKVTIEGIQRQKKDGTKVEVYFNPSNLQIQELNLSDKKREESLKKLKAKGEGKESKKPKEEKKTKEESKKDKEKVERKDRSKKKEKS